MPIDDIRCFLQIIRQYYLHGIPKGAEMLTKYLELEIPGCKVVYVKNEAKLLRDEKTVASSLEGLQYFEE